MHIVKRLLAGVALSGLAAAPAAADPPSTDPGAIGAPAQMLHVITIGGNVHFKTRIRDSKSRNVTSTETFSGTISETGFYKKPTQLWAMEPAVNKNTCVQYKTRAKFPRKTAAGKITANYTLGSVSGCPGTNYKYYGPVYDLTSTAATSDSFDGTVTVKDVGGYNFKMIANTNLNITR